MGDREGLYSVRSNGRWRENMNEREFGIHTGYDFIPDDVLSMVRFCRKNDLSGKRYHELINIIRFMKLDDLMKSLCKLNREELMLLGEEVLNDTLVKIDTYRTATFMLQRHQLGGDKSFCVMKSYDTGELFRDIVYVLEQLSSQGKQTKSAYSK